MNISHRSDYDLLFVDRIGQRPDPNRIIAGVTNRYLNGMERLKEKIQFDFKTLEFWNLEFQC